MSTMIGRIAYPLETSDRQQLRARPAMRFLLLALVVFALCPQIEGVFVSRREGGDVEIDTTNPTQPGQSGARQNVMNTNNTEAENPTAHNNAVMELTQKLGIQREKEPIALNNMFFGYDGSWHKQIEPNMWEPVSDWEELRHELQQRFDQICQPDADGMETNTRQNMCDDVTSEAQYHGKQCATAESVAKREKCMIQRIRETLRGDRDIEAICASCQDCWADVDMKNKNKKHKNTQSCPWSKASNVFNNNDDRQYKQNAQEYPISNLFFTQNKINLEGKPGMQYDYELTMNELKQNAKMAIDTMPPLTIWRDTNGIWGPAGREYSLDNRRLYMYRMTDVATTRAFFVDDAYLLASHKSQIHKFQKHQNTDIVSGRQCIRVVTPDTDNTTPTESCWQVLRYWSGELAL